MRKTILVAEDEIKISNSICSFFSEEGYCSKQAKDGLEAIALFEEFNPDLIILDIMLPKMDGFLVCERIRATSSTPIIMLTGRVDEADKIMGFDKGVDDYVCKPFSPIELVARVKAILRRSSPVPVKNILSYGPITLVVNEHRVKVGNTDVQLTQMEFSLLGMLMAHPNQVFSREELLSSSQGNCTESYDRSIDFHIKNLRKKINIIRGFSYIKTVYGVGYKFLDHPNRQH